MTGHSPRVAHLAAAATCRTKEHVVRLQNGRETVVRMARWHLFGRRRLTEGGTEMQIASKTEPLPGLSQSKPINSPKNSK